MQRARRLAGRLEEHESSSPLERNLREGQPRSRRLEGFLRGGEVLRRLRLRGGARGGLGEILRAGAFARGSVRDPSLSRGGDCAEVFVDERLDVSDEFIRDASAEGLAEHTHGAEGVGDGVKEWCADCGGHGGGHLLLLGGGGGDGADALERGCEIGLGGGGGGVGPATRVVVVHEAHAFHAGRERAGAGACERAEHAPDALAETEVPARERARAEGPGVRQAPRVRLARPQHREHLAEKPLVLRLLHPQASLPRGSVLEERGPHLGSARRGLRPRRRGHPNHQPSE